MLFSAGDIEPLNLDAIIDPPPLALRVGNPTASIATVVVETAAGQTRTLSFAPHTVVVEYLSVRRILSLGTTVGLTLMGYYPTGATPIQIALPPPVLELLGFSFTPLSPLTVPLAAGSLVGVIGGHISGDSCDMTGLNASDFSLSADRLQVRVGASTLSVAGDKTFNLVQNHPDATLPVSRTFNLTLEAPMIPGGPFLDSFNDVDGAPLRNRIGWQQTSGVDDIAVISGNSMALGAISGSAVYTLTYHEALNQSAQAAVIGVGGQQYIGLNIQLSGSSYIGYLLRIEATGALRLFKRWMNGATATMTQIGTTTISAIAIPFNLEFSESVSGGTKTFVVKRDGIALNFNLLSDNGTIGASGAIITGGAPGISITSTGTPRPFLDNWQSGVFTPPVALFAYTTEVWNDANVVIDRFSAAGSNLLDTTKLMQALGGATPASIAITAGDGLGHFTVAGLMVRPSTAGDAADFSSKSYTLSVTATFAGGRTATGTLKVLAPTNVRYCSWTGSDAALGTRAAPWKFPPGAVGATGNSLAYTAPDSLIVLKRGDTFPIAIATPPSGTAADNLFHYGGFTDWNGGSPLAIVSGDDDLGAGAACTQAELSGNPNWASIRKFTFATAPDIAQSMFSADGTMGYPAQWPTPANITEFEGLVDSTGEGGWFQFAASNVVGDSTGNTAFTVTDPVPAHTTGHYGLINMTGRKVFLWCAGNVTRFAALSSYSTSTGAWGVLKAGLPSLSGATLNAPATKAYAFVEHPLDIVKANQQGVSNDGLTRYFKPATPGNVSMSVRKVALTRTGHHQGISNVQIRRFYGPASGTVADGVGCLSDGAFIGGGVSHCLIDQMRSEAGGGAIYQTFGVSVPVSALIERNVVSQCPRSSAVRVAGDGFFIQSNDVTGVGRSCYYISGGDGTAGGTLLGAAQGRIRWNRATGLRTVHGNIYVMYLSVKNYIQEENSALDCARPATYDNDEDTNAAPRSSGIISRNNLFESWFDPAISGTYSAAIYGGVRDITHSRNAYFVVPGSAANDYGLKTGVRGTGVSFDKCVIQGLNIAAVTAQDPAPVITNSLQTKIVASNYITAFGGGSVVTTDPWNGSAFTPGMLNTLGAGRIGCAGRLVAL